MNLSNFVGVITGILFLALAIGFSANDPLAFINLPGLLIVIGGTVTAILVSFSTKEAIAAMKQAKVVMENNEVHLQKDAARLISFSRLWFRKQYRQIDTEIENLDDPFMQRGLQMIRDKHSLDDILAALNWKISQQRAKETGVISVFKSMATFAPAFGMVGSLIGLVNMLQGLEQSAIASVTSDMAIALVTTFYGLLLANLVFKPIATKLEQRRHIRTVRLTMIAEGVAMIYQNRTPSSLQEFLLGFMEEQGDSTVESILKKIANAKIQDKMTPAKAA